MTPRTAILLLAYGTPDTPDEIAPYYTHIRGGRPPTPESLADLRARYEAVGGRTPLTALTEDVRAGVAARLGAAGHDVAVYVGMKHWRPWIADAVAQMKADGIERVIGLVLAPHYSRFSVGGYQRYLFDGMAKHGVHFDVRFVEQWYAHPQFVDLMASLVTEQRQTFDESVRDDVVVLFSAHSLPVRIRSWNDPYEAQLADSARAVAQRAGVRDFRVVWQSAGNTGEPWIGPDILEYLETLRGEVVQNVLQVPIGFVCDHLEILYDLDIEAASRAESLGIAYRRTALPNARPEFLDVLTDVCAGALRGEHVVNVAAPPPSTRRPDEAAASTGASFQPHAVSQRA